MYSTKHSIGDICWVYIIEVNDSHDIRFTTDLERSVKFITTRKKSILSSNKILFFREFPDSLSALGYRIMLTKLSENSLIKVILQYNPNKEDMTDKLIEQITSAT